MSAQKSKKIIFVCTGNTCRSPMAEMICKKLIKELRIQNAKVSSAGIRATRGTPISEKSAAVLEEEGYTLVKFSSKKLTDGALRDGYAIVCMTDSQRDMLMEKRWQLLRKAGAEEIENTVYSFRELTGYEVIDPYQRDMDCYRYVFRLLKEGMPEVLSLVLPETEREYKPAPQRKRKKKE